MAAVNNRDLVADYVKYRLEREGLEWNGRGGVPNYQNPGAVQTTMRTLGKEFESRYNEVFTEMCNQLHITPNTAHPTFTAIVNELFNDGVKWGRIVALFAFGGSLALQCIDREMPPLVDQIIEWVAVYVDTNLQSWIDEHGGWGAFVEFYEGGLDRRLESPWPSLRTFCGYAIGAVGVMTLGAILASKS